MLHGGDLLGCSGLGVCQELQKILEPLLPPSWLQVLGREEGYPLVTAQPWREKVRGLECVCDLFQNLWDPSMHV